MECKKKTYTKKGNYNKKETTNSKKYGGTESSCRAAELRKYGLSESQIQGLSDQELAVWYNDNVIYPDKVRLNCYYYRHYSFIKDIQMILCTVLGWKMKYAGETI